MTAGRSRKSGAPRVSVSKAPLFFKDGYNHATFGGYLAVRPALYAAGDGNAVFRNFRYRTLVTQ